MIALHKQHATLLSLSCCPPLPLVLLPKPFSFLAPSGCLSIPIPFKVYVPKLSVHFLSFFFVFNFLLSGSLWCIDGCSGDKLEMEVKWRGA